MVFEPMGPNLLALIKVKLEAAARTQHARAGQWLCARARACTDADVRVRTHGLVVLVCTETEHWCAPAHADAGLAWLAVEAHDSNVPLAHTHTQHYHYRGIPMGLVRSIAKQVLEGLDFLHTQCSIIHTGMHTTPKQRCTRAFCPS